MTIGSPDGGSGGTEVVLSHQLTPTTGRYVLVFDDESHREVGAIAAALEAIVGVSNVASTRDYEMGALDVEQARGARAVVFAELGVAVVDADPGRVAAIAGGTADDRRIVSVEPERVFSAIDVPPTAEYLRGYRDAAADLLGRRRPGVVEDGPGVEALFADTDELTWGLSAVGVPGSGRTGRGTRLAVLDTGIDLAHPDFVGRPVQARSFVAGERVQDGHGHGTHVAGTAAGAIRPPVGRRYGVAPGAEIFAGKVLGNQGAGTDTNILAGMNWAVANGCRVISMSLGADVRAVSATYEAVGRRALAAGALVVAAAGNNGRRRAGEPGFVGVPANSPSIMAVGAVDGSLAIADFSARSNPVAGGQVDVAGPGVAVYSSWPMPGRYRSISGTSMATPHVAGIAALWSEATGATGAALWSVLVQNARRLPRRSTDVGAGLAQAPP